MIHAHTVQLLHHLTFTRHKVVRQQLCQLAKNAPNGAAEKQKTLTPSQPLSPSPAIDRYSSSFLLSDP